MCDNSIVVGMLLESLKNYYFYNLCFLAMDPKRFYATNQTTIKQINAQLKTRIPPADQSDDSCLSDTDDSGDEYLPTSTGDVSTPDDDSLSSG